MGRRLPLSYRQEMKCTDLGVAFFSESEHLIWSRVAVGGHAGATGVLEEDRGGHGQVLTISRKRVLQRCWTTELGGYPRKHKGRDLRRVRIRRRDWEPVKIQARGKHVQIQAEEREASCSGERRDLKRLEAR